MKKSYSILGIVLIVMAAVWYSSLGPYLTPRVWPGWETKTTYLGTNNYPDPATGQFVGPGSVSAYERAFKAYRDTQNGGLMIEESYTVFDVMTDAVTWQYIFNAPVDPQSGAHLSEKYHGSYFLFPRRVQKTTYIMSFSTYREVPMAFENEETIERLTTYLFSYTGAVDYAFAYASTDEYTGVDVGAGQEIKCWDDQLFLNAWVEPVTGEIVKFSESCFSGDYVYEQATGKQVAPVAIWSGETAGDALIARAVEVSGERSRVLWLNLYIPSLLAILGVLGLILGVTQARKK